MSEEMTQERTPTPIHVDGERLVSYLYDESEPAERALVAAHLELCGFCTEEIAALGATREHLAEWRSPDAVLGFQVSRRLAGDAVLAGDAGAEPASADVAAAAAPPGRVLRPQRWWVNPLPAWAQLAAAMLIFAAGLSLGAARGVGSPGEFSAPRADEISAPSVPAVGRVSASAVAAPVDELTRDVQLLRGELAAVKLAAVKAPSGRPDPALIRQLQALIEESEHRQRNEFTLRAAQLLSDLDAQMRGDLTRINQRVTSVEGTANGLARAVSGTATQPLAGAPR
jgi:hypothetical protein